MNGSPMSSGDLVQMSITMKEGAPDEASLVFALDPSALADGDTSLPRALGLGAAIRISGGYGNMIEPLFRGRAISRAARIDAKTTSWTMRLRAEAPAPASPASDPPVLSLAFGLDVLAFDVMTTETSFDGRVSFIGSPLARPGARIGLKGLPDADREVVTITAVRHSFEEGCWTTEVDFSR